MATALINNTPIEFDASQQLNCIQAAQRIGFEIPSYCWHPSLSVVASCRMCLVEVEKAPKPLPACATPVVDGMKAYTQSPEALAAS